MGPQAGSLLPPPLFISWWQEITLYVPFGPALIYAMRALAQHLQTLGSLGILLENLLLPETVESTIFPTVNTRHFIIVLRKYHISHSYHMDILKSEAFSRLVTISL